MVSSNDYIAALRLWLGVRGLAVKPHCQQCFVSGFLFIFKIHL